MTNIIIENIAQLEHIAKYPIVLTGSENLIQKEISENTWGISFTKKLAKKITKKDIITFIKTLLNEKNKQVSQLKIPATLYIWHDEQTTELRFNIISGHQAKLPFGCIVQRITSYKPIIESFFKYEANRTIPWSEIEILDADDDLEEEIPYTLQVFSQFLTP